MKNLYTKSNKGKIHPSPSTSHSALALLPSAILTLAAVLSLEDQEVLAYLILRSINSNSSSSSSKRCKKPAFDCGCFHCYARFWTRWDSSPNRELIHQAIEAFEDHLARDDLPKKSPKGKARNRRLSTDKSLPLTEPCPELGIPETHVASSPSPDVDIGSTETGKVEETEEGEEMTGNRKQLVGSVQLQPGGGNHHRGLVRKVWPDVLGLFNSRLWSIWSPNA